MPSRRRNNKSVRSSTAGGVDPSPSLMDPLIAAMMSGHQLWGDICFPPARVYSNVVSTMPVSSYVTVAAPPTHTEEELMAQPFARNLELRFSNMYDTVAMSDSDYEAFMTWLFASGWDVVSEHRRSVHAFPDSLPARVWVAPSRFELAAQAAQECCSHEHHEVPTPAPAKKTGTNTIYRFCKAGAECKELGCRYVHGNTIYRFNPEAIMNHKTGEKFGYCKFGAECGSSDLTGLKRSQCLYMHPGETWSESLVITRPAP